MKSLTRRILPALVCLALLAGAASAQDVTSFEKRITLKKLPNGLTLLICERPEAPVFSFFTHVDVGAAQDPQGASGLAHMFEHMAFKGTNQIGTSDYAKESAALAKVEAAYAAYDAERRRPSGSDQKKLAALEKAWKDAIAAAEKYVKVDEFSQIVQRDGGVGMNAFTSEDETGYFYSMPANRLELWAYLESDRFLHPVMREFYKERDVVYEERRMRIDSDPIGRLVEQFVGAAFIAHPYHNWGIGWPSDLTNFTASDAAEFYKKHYVPANMVVTVVGDVKAKEALPILEKYFGRLPARPAPPPMRMVEPPQIGERTVVLRETSQPIYLEGYHRPDSRDSDDAVYQAISDLLSNGRTSRLDRSLVRDKKIAAVAQGFNGFPGDKYPNLFAFFAIPTPGHTPAELRDATQAEIERVKNEDVSDEELQMIKTRSKADLIRKLNDNEGLALELGTTQARFGDWRELFRRIDRIDKVTKADIRRVAAKTFVANNRTVGMLENVKTPAPAAEGVKQ